MAKRKSNGVERRRHGLRISGLPELTGIKVQRHERARPFAPHAHVDGMEIVFLKQGRLRWWLGDEAVEVHGGQVTVTPQLVPHGSFDDVMEPCELAWLTVDTRPSRRRPFLGLPAAEGRALAERLQAWSRRLLPAPPGIDGLFAAMLPLVPTASRVAADRLRLRVLLVDLLLSLDAAQAQPGEAPVSPAIQCALDLVAAHVRTPLTVPELAARSGLSVSTFHRRFRAEVGETPAACILRHRIEAAVARIRGGDEGLATIAADLDFSSSQYLATCVKRLTGRTPRAFRARG